MPPAADVAAARRLLAAAGEAPPNGYKEQSLIYARETAILSETFPNRVKTFVQALRIGDLGIATYPGEALVEMGLELKSKSPFKPTMLIELANEKTAAPKFVASALRQLESPV
jgi:neutral ceramidase